MPYTTNSPPRSSINYPFLPSFSLLSLSHLFFISLSFLSPLALISLILSHLFLSPLCYPIYHSFLVHFDYAKIFIQFPVVEKAYKDNVPTKVRFFLVLFYCFVSFVILISFLSDDRTRFLGEVFSKSIFPS